MCDTFILLKYITDNNIKKITFDADINVEANRDNDTTPNKDNYYSMLCFKDLRISVATAGSSSAAIARSADSRETSAKVNVVKKERLSAMEAIDAPTPPAPITRMFINVRFRNASLRGRTPSLAHRQPTLVS